jgi:hypothetical protein
MKVCPIQRNIFDHATVGTPYEEKGTRVSHQTSIRSSIAGFARPVLTVLKLVWTVSIAFSIFSF